MSRWCGLDFGTSNSALATVYDNKLDLVPIQTGADGQGLRIIPSAVFFNAEERTQVFGQQALDEYVDGYEGRLMRSLKSVLGSSLMGEATQVSDLSHDYSHIIAQFVCFMKSQAEHRLQRSLDQVVVGRPVYFVDGDPAADLRAQQELEHILELAGFKEVSFQYEPIAAALDFERTLTKNTLVLTMDIGGGTSDFSIMQLGPENLAQPQSAFTILANDGIHIGGTDFDCQFQLKTVSATFGLGSTLQSGLDMPVMAYHKLATWHEINSLYELKTIEALRSLRQRAAQPKLLDRLLRLIELRRGHLLAQLIEDAKIQLSSQDQSLLDLSFVERGLTLSLSSRELIEATNHKVHQIMAKAKGTLSQAGLQLHQLDCILLTGGSTAMPGFEQQVQLNFPGVELVKMDRFAGIAKGLSMVAQKRYE